MSAQTWLIIAIVGFTLSAIALVVAIFMYIKMNIPAVIGDLTGKTVAREIKAMREANVASGDKHPRSSSVNVNRGKLTDKVKDEIDDSTAKAVAHASKKLEPGDFGKTTNDKKGTTSRTTSVFEEKTTETLATNVLEVDIEERRATAILSQNRITDMLNEDRVTDVLDESMETLGDVKLNQTSVLNEPGEIFAKYNATSVLSDAEEIPPLHKENATSVLASTSLLQPECNSGSFKVTRTFVIIHTDEVI